MQQHPGESEPVAEMKLGHIDALEGVVRLFQASALRIAAAICGDVTSAEDVVADSFIKAYERIHQFDGRRPFGPWFHRIVVNEALALLRRRRRTARAVDRIAEETRARATVSDPAETALDAEVTRQLMAAIRALPDAERVCIVLRYFGELGEREVATTIGCPEGTVKRRLHDARGRLRHMLTDDGTPAFRSRTEGLGADGRSGT